MKLLQLDDQRPLLLSLSCESLRNSMGRSDLEVRVNFE